MAQTKKNQYISVYKFACAHLGFSYNLANNNPTETQHCHQRKKRKREKKQSILAFPSHHLLLPVYDRSARGERQYWCEENGDDRQDQEKKMMQSENPNISLKRQLQYSNNHSQALAPMAHWQHVNKLNVYSLYHHESHNPSWP